MHCQVHSSYFPPLCLFLCCPAISTPLITLINLLEILFYNDCFFGSLPSTTTTFQMQNIPGGRSSSGGRAGSTSHTVPTTQETQIAPTSVGHQSSDLDAYFNLDPTAAFPFIDPVNQTLIGYSTAAIPSHVIMNQHPNQPAHSLIAYQPRVEIQEQLLPNLHPMASCEAAGPPALNYGTYGGYSLGGFVKKPLHFLISS